MYKKFFFSLFSIPLLLNAGSTLRTTILLSEDQEAIRPGQPITFSAQVSNAGDMANPEGTLYIRYAFPAPLDNHPRSVLFRSESRRIPPILPGRCVKLTFTTPHLLPTLYDYIRDDWAKRHYEAVIEINGEEKVSGSRAILFSAHYYLSRPLLSSKASFNSSVNDVK